jgi:hypothetical protein
MATKQQYFDDLNALLANMPLGKIDMRQIEANERRHAHRFFDPPEIIQMWLLDQQRRVQAIGPVARRRRTVGANAQQIMDEAAAQAAAPDAASPT